MWLLTACKISVSLSFLNWINNEMIFLSYLWNNVATLFQRYDKKSFIFKKERQTEFYMLSCATFYDCTNSIYQFIKPFLDNKMFTFEAYGGIKSNYT